MTKNLTVQGSALLFGLERRTFEVDKMHQEVTQPVSNAAAGGTQTPWLSGEQICCYSRSFLQASFEPEKNVPWVYKKLMHIHTEKGSFFPPSFLVMGFPGYRVLRDLISRFLPYLHTPGTPYVLEKYQCCSFTLAIDM